MDQSTDRSRRAFLMAAAASGAGAVLLPDNLPALPKTRDTAKLKITKVEALHFNRWVIARIETNAGITGIGEAGTSGSLAALMNAIADAIPDGRGADLDMPATPEKVWRACNG